MWLVVSESSTFYHVIFLCLKLKVLRNTILIAWFCMNKLLVVIINTDSYYIQFSSQTALSCKYCIRK